jgi:uncharacterized protein
MHHATLPTYERLELDGAFELKALSDEGRLEGYGSVFNVVDAGRDVVAPFAFKASLATHAARGTKPRMFWRHDPDQPIGVWDELVEDAKGLRMTGRLILEVQRARETHALLKAGALDGLSIGYRARDFENDRAKGVRILRQVDLYEVSVVPMAMNDDARVTSVKGRTVTIRDLERELREGLGLSKREAKALLAEGYTGLLGCRDGGQGGPGSGDRTLDDGGTPGRDAAGGLEAILAALRGVAGGQANP